MYIIIIQFIIVIGISINGLYLQSKNTFNVIICIFFLITSLMELKISHNIVIMCKINKK